MAHSASAGLCGAVIVSLMVSACGGPAEPTAADGAAASAAVTGAAAADAAPAAADPAASAAASVAETGCTAGETVVYSCAIDGKVVAVCSGQDKVVYRYGKSGSPELEIASSGKDDHAFTGVIVGGGRGQQRSIRFAQGAYDYVVYSADAGELMDGPSSWSGLTVFKDGKVVSEKKCTATGDAQRLDFGKIAPALPQDPKVSSDELGWL